MAPPNNGRPFWPLYQDIMVGRLIRRGSVQGEVRFGPFRHPQTFKNTYLIKWQDESDPRVITEDILKTFLQERFVEDATLVPDLILELQSNEWKTPTDTAANHTNGKGKKGADQAPSTTQSAGKVTASGPAASKPAADEAGPSSSPAKQANEPAPASAVAKRVSEAGPSSPTAKRAKASASAKPAERTQRGRRASAAAAAAEPVEEEEEGKVQAASAEAEASAQPVTAGDKKGGRGRAGRGKAVEDKADAHADVDADKDDAAADKDSSDADEDAEAEEYVQGWTGCRYPKSICNCPGDKSANDIDVAEMEGDFEVTCVMDEVKYKGKTWYLIKWQGYELRVGTGNLDSEDPDEKGDWELAANIGSNNDAVKAWKQQKAKWFEANEKRKSMGTADEKGKKGKKRGRPSGSRRK